jgi:hypothetical protein
MTEPDQSLSLTYPELVDEMRRWCADKRTGTMLIATEDNHLAKILFESGAITLLSYGLKNGLEAIPLLTQIGHARLKVSPGRAGAQPAGKTLPPTGEIMALLAEATEARGGRFPANTPLDGEHLAKVLKIIETELIEHLGPLGDIVWTEHLERVGKPLSSLRLTGLIEGLAGEIGDPAKIRLFKDAIRDKIGRA